MNKTWPRVLLTILVVALSSTAFVRAAPGSAAAAEPVTVYLHSAVRLSDSEYTLGQVASVFSADPVRAQALRGLPLGATPIRPTLLPARAIQERIAAVSGGAVVIGARVALLPGVSVSREQEWFYTSLLAFLEAEDTLKVGRIEIELLDTPVFLEEPPDSAAGGQGMDSGWEERIVFQAVRSPYSPGYRSSLSSQVIPGGTMQVSYRVLRPEGGSPARWEGSGGKLPFLGAPLPARSARRDRSARRPELSARMY